MRGPSSVALLVALCVSVGCGERRPSSPAPASETPRAGGVESPTQPRPEPDPGAEEVFDGERHVDMGALRPIRGSVAFPVAAAPVTLNPLTSAVPRERKLVGTFLALPLLQLHPEELDLIPWLAASRPSVGEDGRTLTWRLRDEARWDDGAAITADDAVATFEAIIAGGASTAGVRGSLGPVTAVEKVDERTFRVLYDQPYLLAEHSFGLNFIVAPATGEGAATSVRHLEGSGPYRVASWGDGEVKFERKGDWWGDAVDTFHNRYRVAEFVVRTVSDPVQIREQLKAGRLDFAGVDPDTFYALKEVASLTGAAYHLAQWSYVGWNCTHPTFSDSRVRAAMSHLLPRDLLNARYNHGDAIAVSGPFYYRSVFYDPNVAPRAFDPERARSLLGEAGWRDTDGDGLLDRGGRAFEFTLTYAHQSRAYAEPIVTHFGDVLEQVGIRLKPEVIDIGALQGRLSKDAFEAYFLIWATDPVLWDPGELFHSEAIARWNWQNFCDEDVDRLIERYRTARSDAARIGAARRIHGRLHELQPLMFVFNNASYAVWNRRLHGVHAYALGIREWDMYLEDD